MLRLSRSWKTKQLSALYKRVLSRTTAHYIVIYVKSCAITIHENSIPRIIFIDKGTPLLTKYHVMKKMTRSLCTTAQTIIPKNEKSEWKDPLEYVVKLWIAVRRQKTYCIKRAVMGTYQKTIAETIKSILLRQFINRYWSWQSKRNDTVKISHL